VRNGFAFAAVGSDGHARTWGEAAYGGDSSTVVARLQSNVSLIAAGRFAFAAVTANGSVAAWGVESARTGFTEGGAASASLASLVANEAAFAGIDAVMGAVIAFGSKYHGGNVLDDAYCNGYSAELSAGVRSITALAGAFVAIKVDGSVLAWGNRHSGADVAANVLASLSGAQLVVATRAAFAVLLSTGRVAS
jgi:alpha-tubulin suppressor-like RCC1 family protein